MERMGGYSRRIEGGTGGDPRPTAAHHFRTLIEEVRAARDSDSRAEWGLHMASARGAAFRLVRAAEPHRLRQIGSVLLNGAKDHPESLPVIMDAYLKIREAFTVERQVKAVEIRRALGLPIRGRVFPQKAQ